MRVRVVFLHEWIAGSVALLSCGLLLVLAPNRHLPDAGPLCYRALSNILSLARLQFASAIGIGVAVLAVRWSPFRRCLGLAGDRKILAVLLRATIPLLLMIVFHQSIPVWQRVIVRPEADAALINIDQWLFHGTNPTLWLEPLITPLLTDIMWLAYLSWFIAFQGTLFWMAVFRPTEEWLDMILATVITLTAGYIGYILVPAVGPVHAMTALFTVDLAGSPISAVTNHVVDHFGVWRDAFPSIHVAISVLMVLYAWRYLRRWCGLYTVLGVAIVASTVYLRWHYVIDVLAGAFLAAVSFWLSPRLLAWWKQTSGIANVETMSQQHTG